MAARIKIPPEETLALGRVGVVLSSSALPIQGRRYVYPRRPRLPARRSGVDGVSVSGGLAVARTYLGATMLAPWIHPGYGGGCGGILAVDRSRLPRSAMLIPVTCRGGCIGATICAEKGSQLVSVPCS